VKVRIVPSGSERDPYLPLLLLADESEPQVRGYYQTGDLYAVDDEAGQPLGLVLTVAESDGSTELKAVAVDEARINSGLKLEDLSAKPPDGKPIFSSPAPAK